MCLMPKGILDLTHFLLLTFKSVIPYTLNSQLNIVVNIVWPIYRKVYFNMHFSFGIKQRGSLKALRFQYDSMTSICSRWFILALLAVQNKHVEDGQPSLTF